MNISDKEGSLKGMCIYAISEFCLCGSLRQLKKQHQNNIFKVKVLRVM